MTAAFAWLWEGLVLWVSAWLLLRAMHRASAATRHALWWAALVAVLLVPLGSHTLGSGDPAVRSLTALAGSGAAPRLVPAPPAWLIAGAVLAWLGRLGLGGIRIAAGWRRLRALKACAAAFTPSRESRLVLWNASRRQGRLVELRVSDEVRNACALGLGRPIVLLPRQFVAQLDDDALDQIVMHEKAHLDRYDDVWRLAQAMVDAVAGVHPAVALISRQIDFEREAACDDRVVARTGSSRRYAACLAEAAVLATSAPADGVAAALAPAAIRDYSMLRGRVTRLLHDRDRSRAVRAGHMMTACAALTGLLLVLAAVNPVVVFIDARASSPTVRQPEPRNSVAAQVLASRQLAAPQPTRERTGRDQRRSAIPRRSSPEDLPPMDATGPDRLDRRHESATVLVSTPLAPARAQLPNADSTAEDESRDWPPLDARQPHWLALPPLTVARAAEVRPMPADRGPWMRLAGAGVAIGDGGRSAAAGVASFFTGAGTSVARQF